MPFQGFPLVELRVLKEKRHKGFLYKESCKGRRRKMVTQKASARIRSRIKTMLLSPTVLYETAPGTFR